MVSIGRAAGRRMCAAVTCMDAPLGDAAAALDISEDEALRRAEEALSSGAARAKLAELVEAQGGDARYVYEPQRFAFAPGVRTVRAAGDGYLRVDALALGRACVELGGGRKKEGDEIDRTVAIFLQKRPGARVRAGEPLAEVRYNAPSEAAFTLIDGAFRVAGRRAVRPLIYTYIDGKEN